MKQLLIISFILAAHSVVAQVEFEEQNIIDDTNWLTGTSSIFVADLDGDGDDDILASTSAAVFLDQGISWFENLDGLGNFGDQQGLEPNDTRINKVIAADIDNDGDLDIAAVGFSFPNSNIGIVVWYPNLDGQGNFGDRQIISTFQEKAISVIGEDMDGDGNLDLVVALESTKIVLFKNLDGLGDFSDEILISDQAISVRSISVADIDGDGDKDVLSASVVDDEIAWYENINNTTIFGSKQIIADFDAPTFVMAIDLDNDNDQDIIYSSSVGDKMVWRKNLDGLGAFSDEIVISETIDGPTKIRAADIDNDNDIDIVVSAINEDNFLLFTNDIVGGEASFSGPINASTLGGRNIVLSDLNNDGGIDIVGLNGYITWHANNIEDLSFTLQSYITFNAPFANQTTAADLDNDGDIDFIIHSGQSSYIMWLEKIDGVEDYFPHYGLDGGGPHLPGSVEIGDIDNDGDIDLLFSSPAVGRALIWLENIDNATSFISHTIISDLQFGTRPFAGDMDNDNDLDVVAVVLGGLYWFENLDGLGTYSDPIFIADAMFISELSDVDNDNDLDIIAGSSDLETLEWYENIDNGNSFVSVLVDTVLEVESTNSIDMDEDGDQDLLAVVVAFEDDNFIDRVILYENLDGEGLFNEGTIIEDDLNGIQVQVVGIDLDLDGDNDIVVLSRFTDNALGWYENFGDNNYGDRITIANDPLRGRSLLAVDIDQDTDTDLIVTYSTFPEGSKVTLYRNSTILSVSNENLDLFSVYPNPVTSTLTVNAVSEIVAINIFDNLGKLVLTKKQSNEISLASLTNGIYYINILDINGHTETEKVIKQ